MDKKNLLYFALSLRSLSLWLPCASGSIYVHVGHARVEFLIQEMYPNCMQAVNLISESEFGHSIIYFLNAQLLGD